MSHVDYDDERRNTFIWKERTIYENEKKKGKMCRCTNKIAKMSTRKKKKEKEGKKR